MFKLNCVHFVISGSKNILIITSYISSTKLIFRFKIELDTKAGLSKISDPFLSPRRRKLDLCSASVHWRRWACPCVLFFCKILGLLVVWWSNGPPFELHFDVGVWAPDLKKWWCSSDSLNPTSGFLSWGLRSIRLRLTARSGSCRRAKRVKHSSLVLRLNRFVVDVVVKRVLWISSLKVVGSVPASYPASRSNFIFSYVLFIKFR